MSYQEDLRRIKDGLPAVKREWDRSHLWIGLAARPLSFPLSAFLLGRGVTANQVTVATAVIGYGSLLLLASASPACMLAGGLGLTLYNLLDCVDGNLARVSPPESPPRGKFLDQVVGNSYYLSYLALGLGLRQDLGDEAAWEVVHLGAASTQAWRALALGALATGAKYLMFTVKNDFWAVLGEGWEASKARAPADAPHRERWYYSLFYAVTDLQSHVILLPAALAAGWAFEFLAVSAAVCVLECLGVCGLYLRRAWRMGRSER